MLSWPAKDPDEVLDYQVDWSERLLSDEEIDTSAFTIAEGSVVIDSDTLVGPVATVWLSGGEIGEACVVLNRIVTTNVPPRTYDQSVRLRIRSH